MRTVKQAWDLIKEKIVKREMSQIEIFCADESGSSDCSLEESTIILKPVFPVSIQDTLSFSQLHLIDLLWSESDKDRNNSVDETDSPQLQSGSYNKRDSLGIGFDIDSIQKLRNLSKAVKRPQLVISNKAIPQYMKSTQILDIVLEEIDFQKLQSISREDKTLNTITNFLEGSSINLATGSLRDEVVENI